MFEVCIYIMLNIFCLIIGQLTTKSILDICLEKILENHQPIGIKHILVLCFFRLHPAALTQQEPHDHFGGSQIQLCWCSSSSWVFTSTSTRSSDLGGNPLHNHLHSACEHQGVRKFVLSKVMRHRSAFPFHTQHALRQSWTSASLRSISLLSADHCHSDSMLHSPPSDSQNHPRFVSRNIPKTTSAKKLAGLMQWESASLPADIEKSKLTSTKSALAIEADIRKKRNWHQLPRTIKNTWHQKLWFWTIKISLQAPRSRNWFHRNPNEGPTRSQEFTSASVVGLRVPSHRWSF